jgi:hypothetical protein
MFLFVFSEVADVLTSLADAESRVDAAKALKTYARALEIVYFCFGTEHYKYSQLCSKIQSLGGSVPTFSLSVKNSGL